MAKSNRRPIMLTRVHSPTTVMAPQGGMTQPTIIPPPIVPQTPVVPSAANVVPGTVTNSDILGTLGGAIGTAVLGPGVGTAIGAAVGGLADRALAGSRPDCPDGFVRNQFGVCEFVGSPGDVSTGGTGVVATPIAATSGGGGVAPAVSTRTVLRCPSGMVLGKDNRCYRSLPKRDRKWNPGRKPLLTGGEMNAIAKAARAAKKLKSAEKRLAKAGRTLAPRKSTSRSRSRPRTVMGPTPTHTLTVVDTE